MVLAVESRSLPGFRAEPRKISAFLASMGCGQIILVSLQSQTTENAMKTIKLLTLILLTAQSSLFAAPFWFMPKSDATGGLSAIYLASQTMDLSKDAEVAKAVLQGDVVLYDGGHESYTLTLPYKHKGEVATTEFTLRRHGLLFGLTHTDNSDRSSIGNLDSVTPFKLHNKYKDRFKLSVASEFVKDPELRKAMKAVKLSRDGLFARNKYKFKLDALRMFIEANFDGKQQEQFQELHED